MKPDPEPVALPRIPPTWLWIVTTAGATLFTALMTALDSSIVTSRTFVVSDALLVGIAATSRSMRFVTPTAVSAPETIPATTATATSGAAAMPPRTRAGVGFSGGRLVHAGASSPDGVYSRSGAGP